MAKKKASPTSTIGRYFEIPEIELCDSGYWLCYRLRRRLVLCSRKESLAKQKELKALEIIRSMEATRILAQNSVKTVYYRDEDGKICLPPNGVVPAGYDREEIKSISEADRLCREMSRELKEKFDYDCTDYLDHIQRDKNGNLPRDVIVSEMQRAGAYGKEVAEHMLKVLDQEERDRKSVNTNVFFRWRES